jgi:hypothetical protein
MKYESETAMMIQHVDDAIETTGGVYDKMLGALFGPVVYVMLMANKQNLTEVIKDIRTMTDQYIARAEALMASNTSPKRTLN